MKNLFLTAAALVVMLSLNAYSHGPSGRGAGKKASAVSASPAASIPPSDCDEAMRLPIECDPSCRSRACRNALLRRHEVEESEVANYKPMGGPFVYKDFTFGGLLNNNDCDANFYFEVFQKEGGRWYSNVFVNRYTHDDARVLPLPLLKALYREYRKNFSQLEFYWLDESPRCPKGKDVLMKIIFQNGDHAFYNVSLPPVAAQRIPSTPDLDRDAVPQSAP